MSDLCSDKVEQIDLLATYIMENIDGEPSQSEGAGDCAIRLLKTYATANAAQKQRIEELEEQEIRLRLDWQTMFGKLKNLEAERDRLRVDCQFLLSLMPEWAIKDPVPSGLCGTMYGTLTRTGDQEVVDKVKEIRAALSHPSDKKGPAL
jgi:hypothetical protein